MAGPKLEYQVYIRTTPDRLWEAITRPEHTRDYFYGMAVRSDWRPGSSIQHQAPDGQAVLDGKVIEVTPKQKLVTTFAQAGFKDRASRVTWDIQQMGAVCLLNLVHDDFEAETETYNSVRTGWNPVLSGLKTLLETGKPLEVPQPATTQA